MTVTINNLVNYSEPITSHDRDEEMAQWLVALACKLERLNSIAETIMVGRNN